MNTNFESAVSLAIEVVAGLLGISPEAVAEKAKQDGPVRDSVMMLVCAGKEAV